METVAIISVLLLVWVTAAALALALAGMAGEADALEDQRRRALL